MLKNEDKQWIREEIKNGTRDLRADVARLETRMDSLETRMDSLETKVDALEVKVDRICDTVTRTGIYLESTLGPLVSELGHCYTSAMSDCRNRTEEIDEMKMQLSACISLTQENSVKIRCMEVADGAKASR